MVLSVKSAIRVLFMVLTEDHSNATYQIKSFSPGKIVINSETYTNSLIISPYKIITPWKPTTTDTITDDDLLLLLTTQPEIILLGTGKKISMLVRKKISCGMYEYCYGMSNLHRINFRK